MSFLDGSFARFSAICAISCPCLTLDQEFRTSETLSVFVSWSIFLGSSKP